MQTAEIVDEVLRRKDAEIERLRRQQRMTESELMRELAPLLPDHAR